MSEDESMSDRMKKYEMESESYFDKSKPICVRLDGKRFSKFTEDLKRPYDEGLSRLMVDTTKFLIKEAGAILGYTQSDEISLILFYPDNTQMYLGGRVQKLASVLSSAATAYFNKHLQEYLPEKDELAMFDCRVWQVPNKNEAVNSILWREYDAKKNSITMAARCFYSDSEIFQKNSSTKIEMLSVKNINWHNYPEFFKYGIYLKSIYFNKKYSAAEIENLPKQHNARKNPDFEFTRTDIVTVNRLSLSDDPVCFVFGNT